MHNRLTQVSDCGLACRQRRRPLSPLCETPFAACAASPFAGASTAGGCSSSSSASAAGDARHELPTANTAATTAGRRAAATVSFVPSAVNASCPAVCSSCPRVAATPRLRASKPRANANSSKPPFRTPSSSDPLVLPPSLCGSGADDATAAVRPRTAASSCPGRSLSRSTCGRLSTLLKHASATSLLMHALWCAGGQVSNHATNEHQRERGTTRHAAPGAPALRVRRGCRPPQLLVTAAPDAPRL